MRARRRRGRDGGVKGAGPDRRDRPTGARRPDGPRGRGDTALHRAAAAGRLACVKIILDALPADACARLLNAANGSGASPLVQALGSSHGRVALLLCSRGADPEGVPPRMREEEVGADMMSLLRRAAEGELEEL